MRENTIDRYQGYDRDNIQITHQSKKSREQAVGSQQLLENIFSVSGVQTNILN